MTGNKRQNAARQTEGDKQWKDAEIRTQRTLGCGKHSKTKNTSWMRFLQADCHVTAQDETAGTREHGDLASTKDSQVYFNV